MKLITKDILEAMEYARSEELGKKHKIGNQKENGAQFYLSMEKTADGHYGLWKLYAGNILRLIYDAHDQMEWCVAELFERYITM